MKHYLSMGGRGVEFFWVVVRYRSGIHRVQKHRQPQNGLIGRIDEKWYIKGKYRSPLYTKSRVISCHQMRGPAIIAARLANRKEMKRLNVLLQGAADGIRRVQRFLVKNARREMEGIREAHRDEADRRAVIRRNQGGTFSMFRPEDDLAGTSDDLGGGDPLR